MKSATCHPERPANTRGLCKQCYDAERYRAQEDAAKSRARIRYDTHRNTELWRRRVRRLRARYGITPEDYERMHDDQGGVCAICLRECSSGKLLAVDHCHRSGAVRGLLCSMCNKGLGSLRDDPSLLRAAITYLERSSNGSLS